MQDNKDLLQSNESELVSDDLAHRDQLSLIFHLLYAADSYNYEISINAIADNFERGFNLVIPHEGNVFKMSDAVIQERDELDKQIQPLLANWRFERLGTITRLITRMGIWQMIHTELDNALIINECVELAKCFAERDAYKFINGVLDEFAKRNSRQE